jgi:hypothetical protein
VGLGNFATGHRRNMYEVQAVHRDIGGDTDASQV